MLGVLVLDDAVALHWCCRFMLQDEDFQEIADMGRRMEAQYGHLFDYVLVNDRLPDACMELLSAVQRAQDEPQWVPALWVSPADRP